MHLKNRPALVLALLASFAACTSSNAQARELSFDDRVAAQKAIEQVYWSHRIWPTENPEPKPPLSAVMTDETIRASVEDGLKKSNALGTIWRRPVTGEQLQAEMDRMARDSRDPQVLRELFDALGNDPTLIAETLARQTLVDALIRDACQRDERIHRQVSFETWWAGRRASVSAVVAEPFRSYVLPRIAEAPSAQPMAVSAPATVPGERYRHTAVWTGTAMIVWGGTGPSPAMNTGGLYFPSTNTWLATSTGAGVPAARSGHTAVWTGSEMIIWGGEASGTQLGSGGRYVPATDGWTATSGVNAPTARQRHTAVWTGTRMIVWGGHGSDWVNTGGRYDPVADTWTATSTASAPAARFDHTAIWTGTQMIVWGGDVGFIRLDTGSRYTLDTDSWDATTPTSAPLARSKHTAVWTGTQMIVWGGSTGFDNLNTGSRYTPSSNTWSATATTAGVPTIRQLHTAVWTGAEMIVWGGTDGGVALGTGGRYNPTGNTWISIPSGSGAPGSRYSHSAVWTGTAMIVWGGYTGSLSLDNGGRYDASGSVWSTTDEVPPVIAYQPTPQATLLGGRARFTVIGVNNFFPTYQWRKDGVELSNGGTISGATTDVLTLTGVTTADVANYSVVVSNATGSATSVDAALTVANPQEGDVDFTFDPGSSIDSPVLAVAVQPDGKVLIGGHFESVDGATRGRIARLNADGSTDHTFGNGFAGANGVVNSVAVQPDGRALIGGAFTAVNGVSRNGVARLNADGSLDTTFLNGLAGPTGGGVSSVAVQPDGRVLIGGGFTTVDGVSRNRVARLNADGSLDTTFLSGLTGANNSVSALAVQPDGRVVIGGGFTTVNGVNRSRVARLNADGSLDTTFSAGGPTGANDSVSALAVQADGRVVIGGIFTTVSGVSRNNIARLLASGLLDTTFLGGGLAGANGAVRSVTIQPDHRVLIGGGFSAVNAVGRNGIARLTYDGFLDTTFLNGLAGASNTVHSVAVHPDGRVLIGGDFATVNGVNRNRVARLNANGSLDTTFVNGLASASLFVMSLAVQPDGRVLIGGSFATVDGVTRNSVARLNADGSLDTGFLNGLAGTDGLVNSVAVQPDGRVLIGGDFTRVNGVTRNNIARLNADGSLDTTFLNGLGGPNGPVNSVVVQPDTRVLIGGTFTSVNGVSRNNIARLDKDGALDTAFLNALAGANSSVHVVAVQPDSRVLIGGLFTLVNGVSRNSVARLNADGSLDTTFLNGLAGANSVVYSVAVEPGGRVLIGGNFTTVNVVGRTRVARLNADGTLDTAFSNGLAGANGVVRSVSLQPDGRVLIAGQFTMVNGVGRNYVARLNADGSLDTTFLNGLAGASNTVFSVAVLPDGRVLIGGLFSSVNGVGRARVARLFGTPPFAPTITVEPSAQASYDGCCAVFRVTATGTPRNYQWRKDGVDLADGGNVSGATTDTLRIAGVSASDEGDYSVVVTNFLGSDTSLEAALTVAPVPPCKVATCDPVLGCVLVTFDPDGDGVSVCDGDCDDADAAIYPGAPQLCDGKSNNCSDPSWPAVPPNEANVDGDSFRICQGDCDDGDSSVYPGAEQLCDGKNNNCSAPGWPSVPANEADADEDGYRVCQDDCNDSSQAVHPGAVEICDGVDNDCTGQIDEDELGVDSDADGLHNACDNCRVVANPTQSDSDGDHIGNACDNCINSSNPSQVDADGDGRGDTCDNCRTIPNALQDDTDVDRVGDACDDCPLDFNPSQSDFNHDGEGDVCDFNDGLIYVFSTDENYREWQAETGYAVWNSYRGSLTVLRATGQYTQAPGSNPYAARDCGLGDPYVFDSLVPSPGDVAFNLVTGVTGGVESSLGTNSAGTPRPNANPCP